MSSDFYKIIDTFPLPAFILNKELSVLNVNTKGLQMMDLSLSEMQNLSLANYFPEINLCITMVGKNFDTIYMDRNFQKHHITINYVSFENDQTTGILYIIEIKNALDPNYISRESEIENQKQIQFTNNVLNNIPADIAVFDANHNYLFVNSNGISNDFTRNWLIGKNDFDYCAHRGLDDSIAHVRHNYFKEAIGRKEKVDWIDEYYKDEKVSYILRRFYPHIVDGELLYVIGYGIDITELKSTQATAAKNELRNQLILKSALDAIVMINAESKITFWNPQAEIIFGWKSDEVLGRTLIEVIIPESVRTLYSTGFERSKSSVNGIVFNKLLELQAINRNEIMFPVELTILPIDDSFGQITFCAFIRDISFRKNKEKEIANQNKILQNQNHELEQFTYITSHDLQEPLLTLMSFSELLLEEYSHTLDDEARLYIQFINKSAVRMRALVTGLMEYARIGSKEPITEVDCNLLVDEVLHDLEIKINLNKAEIHVHKLPVITGYITFLRLLFQNLISNAIKFKKTGGIPKINIQSSENDTEWIFSISDNGIGIDIKNKDEIFIIFKKLNNQDKYEGYGIGLAHSKKIIDLHNGEIWIDSALGEGSTFTFTISKLLHNAE